MAGFSASAERNESGFMRGIAVLLAKASTAERGRSAAIAARPAKRSIEPFLLLSVNHLNGLLGTPHRPNPKGGGGEYVRTAKARYRI